jgi:hypothetical protein
MMAELNLTVDVIVVVAGGGPAAAWAAVKAAETGAVILSVVPARRPWGWEHGWGFPAGNGCF